MVLVIDQYLNMYLHSQQTVGEGGRLVSQNSSCSFVARGNTGRGGQTFPKSTEFRNSVAFCPIFCSLFPCYSIRVAESVS